jgi:hypothetical protein
MLAQATLGEGSEPGGGGGGGGVMGLPPQAAANSRNASGDRSGLGLSKVGISGLKGVAVWVCKLKHDNEF